MNRLDTFLTDLDTYSLKNQLSHALKDCDTAIELGCGFNSPLLEYGFTKKVKISAIDIYDPYISYHNRMLDYHDCQVADITKLDLTPYCYDAVIILDTLEHLKKGDGERIIKKAMSWAQKKVIIQVPNGYIENIITDSNQYQEHLSGWYPDDFWEKGFEVHGINGYKPLRGENGSSALRWQFAGHFTNLLTNPLVFNHPDYAYHLFAVWRKE